MGHREGMRAYLKDVEVYGTVIDWGCGTKPIQKNIHGNAKFINVDRRDYDYTNLVADIEKPLDIEKADFAFCLEVLEHVWNPVMVVQNIFNNLKAGGYLYLSVPYHYPTHLGNDRIRFTHIGLKQLLTEAGFKVKDISATEGELETANGFISESRK